MSKTFAVTGWAMHERTRGRLGVDHAVPLSDHADYDELFEAIDRVSPRAIYCTHGPLSFVDRLREQSELTLVARAFDHVLHGAYEYDAVTAKVLDRSRVLGQPRQADGHAVLAEITIRRMLARTVVGQFTVVIPQFDLVGLTALNPSGNRVIGGTQTPHRATGEIHLAPLVDGAASAVLEGRRRDQIIKHSKYSIR